MNRPGYQPNRTEPNRGLPVICNENMCSHMCKKSRNSRNRREIHWIQEMGDYRDWVVEGNRAQPGGGQPGNRAARPTGQPGDQAKRATGRPDQFFFFFSGTASPWSLGTGEAIFDPLNFFEKIKKIEFFIIFVILDL